MKRVFLIVGLVLLGGALVFFNQGVKKSATPDHDEDGNAPQAQAQKSPSAPGASSAALPPEEAVGDPATATHHITVGWVYDEMNQQKPETLTVPIEMVRDLVGQSAGIASAEIVNLDIPVEDRSPAAQAVTELGVRVDGNPLSEGNLSETPFSRDRMISTLQEPVKRK